jgi:sarcosine oxidase
MKCVVIGAGAWGLPTAAALARRGHDTVLIDRYGVLNAWSSSRGPTRLWRLADPDPIRLRLAMRSVEAMRRLSERANSEVFLRRGLLWRDDTSLPMLVGTMSAAGVDHEVIDAQRVGDRFPGLRPDGRDGVWQPEAGVVLAAKSLRAQYELFEHGGGASIFGREVSGVAVTATGTRVEFADGGSMHADAAVLTAGPGAAALLAGLGIDLPLRPYLEQVVHFGDPERPGGTDGLPCLFDGPRDGQPGLYAMPSPGIGYKVGLDTPLRRLQPDDMDRSPDSVRTASILDRVRADITAVTPNVVDAEVCSWTDSPDGKFVIDVLEGGVVLACGDCGEGFKYSALMGEVLADLAEGNSADGDIATYSLARFADGIPPPSGPHVMGRI